MIGKATKRSAIKGEGQGSSKNSQKTINRNANEKMGNEIGLDEDLRLLREAVVQLRLTAERIELDKQIAGGHQEAA